MSGEERKFKNLSTYAVLMILAVIILIIIAAMADNREQEFKNEQEQTVMSIQNEIVRLTDENHNLAKEKDELKTQLETVTASNSFYSVMTSAWELYNSNDTAAAAEKLAEINPDTMDETQKASYDALIKLLKEE